MPFWEEVDIDDSNMKDGLNNVADFLLDKSMNIIKNMPISPAVQYIDKKIPHGGWGEKLSNILHNTILESNDKKIEIIDSRLEKAIQWARDIANNNSIWYKYWWSGNGWYDCSHFVTAAIKEGWFDVPVTWGGDMKKNLGKVWFIDIPYPWPEKLKPWDVVWQVGNGKSGHVELYAWNNEIIWAHSDKDKKPWDSSKEEISVRDARKSLQRRNPTRILRYTWEPMA